MNCSIELIFERVRVNLSTIVALAYVAVYIHLATPAIWRRILHNTLTNFAMDNADICLGSLRLFSLAIRRHYHLWNILSKTEG